MGHKYVDNGVQQTMMYSQDTLDLKMTLKLKALNYNTLKCAIVTTPACKQLLQLGRGSLL